MIPPLVETEIREVVNGPAIRPGRPTLKLSRFDSSRSFNRLTAQIIERNRSQGKDNRVTSANVTGPKISMDISCRKVQRSLDDGHVLISSSHHLEVERIRHLGAPQLNLMAPFLRFWHTKSNETSFRLIINKFCLLYMNKNAKNA